MARIARDPVDVILGEATRGSWSQRYNDMLAIASVIHNRAQAGRVSYQDVVGVRSQFNAYGKSLPRGVENYRTLAQMALQQVQKHGPIHNATYYATPKAAKNLPAGLQPVTKTAGHVYFSDPKGRSFQTAKGYVSPAPVSVAMGDVVTPTTAPVPSQAPRGLGMAALAPNGLKTGQIDLSPLSAPGKGRSQVPTSGIVGMVAESANRTVPGAVTSLWSGMEPPGRAPVGTADRHPRGFAGDFDFYTPAGSKITDPVALHDIAMDMAARHNANIGYSQAGYMGPGRMHVDVMPLGQFPGGAQWGDTAKSWAGNLDIARATGIGPTPYSNAPTPTSREVGLSMPAPVAPTQRQAEDLSMRALNATPSPRAAETQSMAALAAQTPQTPAQAYGQLATTMGQAGVRGLGVQPPTVAPPAPVAQPVQQPAALPPTTPRNVPSLMSVPATQTVAPPAQPAAPPTPTGLEAIQGLFNAPEGATAKPSWEPDTTFTSLGDGRVSMTNKYGVTRDVTEDWGMTPRHEAQSMAKGGGLLGRAGGLLGETFGPGGAGRGMLGGMAGSTIGGALAGPLGAMALGAIGRNIAMGNGPLGRGQGYNFGMGRNAPPLGRNELSGLLGGFTPGLGFPSMPSPPTHHNPYAGGNSPSYADMAGISPAAAAAISEGRGGLY